MLQRRARRFAVVFEDQDVLEPSIFFQVENAIPECPQDIFNSLRGQGGQIGIVIGRFDNDLMRPNPIHTVKHSFRLPVQIAFNA